MAHRLIKIPPMLSATISMGIASLDGALFKEIGNCPHCGGRPMPYDTKTKNYATLLLPGGSRTVTVKVRRFLCKECGSQHRISIAVAYNGNICCKNKGFDSFAVDKYARCLVCRLWHFQYIMAQTAFYLRYLFLFHTCPPCTIFILF